MLTSDRAVKSVVVRCCEIAYTVLVWAGGVCVEGGGGGGGGGGGFMFMQVIKGSVRLRSELVNYLNVFPNTM